MTFRLKTQLHLDRCLFKLLTLKMGYGKHFSSKNTLAQMPYHRFIGNLVTHTIWLVSWRRRNTSFALGNFVLKMDQKLDSRRINVQEKPPSENNIQLYIILYVINRHDCYNFAVISPKCDVQARFSWNQTWDMECSIRATGFGSVLTTVR